MVNSVTLFYNETCSTCLQARDRLADLLAAVDIPFHAKEVSNDVNNRDYLILSSGQVGSPEGDRVAPPAAAYFDVFKPTVTAILPDLQPGYDDVTLTLTTVDP